MLWEQLSAISPSAISYNKAMMNEQTPSGKQIRLTSLSSCAG
jgi:hypothetical protein